MVKARQEDAWWHTASMLAAVQNLFATKGHAVTVAECHPMKKKQKPDVVWCKFGQLKDIFCPDQKSKSGV